MSNHDIKSKLEKIHEYAKIHPHILDTKFSIGEFNISMQDGIYIMGESYWNCNITKLLIIHDLYVDTDDIVQWTVDNTYNVMMKEIDEFESSERIKKRCNIIWNSYIEVLMHPDRIMHLVELYGMRATCDVF